MKISNVIVLSVFVMMACSKSESPEPALQNAKVATTTVSAPSGLTTASNTNTHAAEVVSYMSVANSMSNFTAMFAVPASGAQKQSSPITAINGRVAATAGNSVTYVWSDPQYGSVAYQVTDNGTSYHWEYFYKSVGGKDWYKYLNAEAMKDGSSGHLEVLDFTGSDPKAVEASFKWQKTGTQYIFQWTEVYGYFLMTVDTGTKAGTLNYYNGTGVNALLSASYTWDSTGHGSWKDFDTDGKTIVDQGTW